jgi:hypothetical protein
MKFTLEDEDHAVGGSALFKEDVTGLGDYLFAVAGEPEAVFEGQALQGGNVVDRSGDFFRWSGTGRRGEGRGRGKHPGDLLGAVSG